MKYNQEIEYKMLLTQPQFNLLQSFYPDFKAIKQKNIYYDSLIQPLHIRKMGMRIRDIENCHEFTLKVKNEYGHMEYNVLVASNSVYALQQPDIVALFNQFEIIGPFKAIGELTTWRTLIPLNEGDLCLDCNQYNRRIDYEVEFEVTKDSDKGMKELIQVLKQAELSYIPNKKSKIARCLHSIKQ